MIIVIGIRNIRATAFRALGTIRCSVAKVSQYLTHSLTHSFHHLLPFVSFVSGEYFKNVLLGSVPGGKSKTSVFCQFGIAAELHILRTCSISSLGVPAG